MDFKGQKLARDIVLVVMSVSTVIGFLVGYTKESFYHTFVIIVTGFVVCLIATVPSWSIYNRDTIQWTPTGKNK